MSLGVTSREIRGVEMKRRSLKAKDDCLFWSSAKHRKEFSKINDSVNSSLRKWIIYHPRLIKYPIGNYYITVKFDDEIRGVNTEVRQKVIFKVSVYELRIDILKIYATRFYMAYEYKGLFCISSFAL